MSQPTEELRELPEDWRDHLPNAKNYYRWKVDNFSSPNALGWAKGICPFCSSLEDRRAPSLSVRIKAKDPAKIGDWVCFAGCGSGDLVSFHMKLFRLNYNAAVRDLIGVRE